MPKKLLLAFHERAKELGLRHTLLLTVASHPGEAICRAVEAKQVDFLYVGSRGLGLLKRMLLGSVSKYLTEHASCNVVVVKQKRGANSAGVPPSPTEERPEDIQEKEVVENLELETV